MGLRAGLDRYRKDKTSCLHQGLPPEQPAHTKSPYQVHYPGPSVHCTAVGITLLITVFKNVGNGLSHTHTTPNKNAASLHRQSFNEVTSKGCQLQLYPYIMH